MTDEDRQAVADLAMRALDTILEDYGEDTVLRAASLVFEVESDNAFHVNYKSLERNSPHHIGGLYQGMALHILGPAGDDA
jgi:predicted Zn-dependent protease with MMP-like domain